MKSCIFLLLCFLPLYLCGQSETSGIKWKSAIGNHYLYSGEIQNGKPHGKGVAISVNGEVKVFGNFKNGVIDGNAVAFYSNGKVTIALWKNGYANGPGVAMEKDGSIYYGTFVNGFMEDKTIKIFNNNKIVVDNLKNSQSNGRAIVIEEAGTIISDIVYVDDIANGPGIQYEVEGKKKFEGFWENGKWLRAATINYPSFMGRSSFSGIKNDKQVIMYSALSNGNPQDTCFAYDISSGYRYFGYFENGRLLRGIRIIGRSEYCIGGFDADGRKQGIIAEYIKGKYLCLGTFKDNMLNGHAVYIDFSGSDTIVYDGEYKDGGFTGSGAKLDAENTVLVGNFNMGALASGGKKIFRKSQLAGETELITSDGKINMLPKDVCTALNFLLKEFDNNFKSITGNNEFESENTEKNPFLDEYSAWRSPYRFPGALVNKIVKAYKQNNFYFGLAVSDNYLLIKKKYDALCSQLKACGITSLQKGKMMKLSGSAKVLKPGEEVITVFHIPVYGEKTRTPRIVISIEKFGKYQLTAQITSYQEIE